MDSVAIKKLEENVARAIACIQQLHQENRKLKNEVVKLLNQLKERDLLIQHLQTSHHDSLEVSDEGPDVRVKEAMIKSKIQHMLDKLEKFQQLSMK